jgi:NDP-sugar pyrophosphorylase family protein/thiamine kinase-like enzyme
MNKINVFILAAGQGERLRPITDHIPKPLVPLAGRPALQYVLDKIAHLPYSEIGINTRYKYEVIEDWVSQYSLHDRINLFHEETVLGTGGALKNAEAFLGLGTFLVHNSDILSDIDLNKLLDHHQSSGNLVTLAVHDCPKFNSLVIQEKGMLAGMKKDLPEENALLKAFTGIAVYEPEFLTFLPAGESSVVDAWFHARTAGHDIGTFDMTGCSWSDIGTPSAYASAVFDMLRSEGETVYVYPSMKDCNDVELQGNVVIEEGCVLQGEVVLRNCIVLPGGNVRAIRESPLHENCIIGPDYKIDLSEEDILTFDNGRQLIGTGGSDRKYFRVREGDKSLVLMQCGEDDTDFERQIEYTQFLLKHGVSVPELISVEAEEKRAVFEDAGDISLYSYLKYPRNAEEIENIYKKIIDALIHIHTEATEHVSECPLLEERVFDYEYFRWETEYFIERFIEGNSNIHLKKKAELEKELDSLAAKADSFQKTIIHRDFQSQNIMIMKGREIRIIDYQGARIGPPAYDIASILWDPYYRLMDKTRGRLLNYYIENAGLTKNFDKQAFKDSLLTCRLQRHMQALGAYGFLSSVKGKKYFLKYVPEAVRLLKEDVSLSGGTYPVLYELIMGL